jgi:chromate transport protein ChrA
VSPLDRDVPPVGEEIHLPGPTIQPLLLAIGVTVALVGLTASTILLVAGSVLAIVVIVRWIRDVIHDIDQLPLEHKH